jgi:magnesium-transporting ATPase (P-type)
MKKTLILSTILSLAVFSLGANSCFAALSGETEVSETAVASGENFTVTIRGESDEVEDELAVVFYLEGDPEPIAYLWCNDVSVCTKSRIISQDEEGSYTYYGRIITEGESSFRTNSVIVEVSAAPPGGGDGGDTSGGIGISIDNPLNATSFEALINGIINFIFVVALAITPLMIVIAGFYFITAAGNPQKIDTAKKIILYTAIGLAIVLLAKGLIALIQSVIGVEVI